MGLKGKTVLITGAAVRVGRILALAAAGAGADVVVHYGTSSTAAERLGQEIRAMGRRAFLIQADLNDPVQVSEVIPRAIENGPLYALVNSAAIFEPLSWSDTRLEDWQRHLQINLTAPFQLSQAFASSLSGAETGKIVNILDWRALRPGIDHFPYTISKSGLASLTLVLAQALAPRVTVNGLALGAILKPSDGGDEQAVIRRVPAGRWAEPEEVAEALLFLLDGPAYITGEILHLDGGRSLVA